MRATPVLALPVTVVAALAIAAAAPAANASSSGASASRSSTPATPHPVDPTVVSLPLKGVDAAAQAAIKASASATHGAPGATQTLATKDAAVLTAPASTKGFQTLGVTWLPTNTPPDLVISVKTKTNGTWTAWTALDTDDDDGSEDPVVATGLTAAQAAAKGLRAGTSSLWVGPSNGVQVRVVVRSGRLPGGLNVELINPGSSAADADVAPDEVGTATGVAAATGIRAAQANEPQIYSRKAWGADESKVRAAPTYMSTVKAAVIHHTAGPNNYTRAQVPGIIRGDYAYHLSRGWNDIGYNALVDRFGRIWEGRAGGIDKAVMGAHAGGFNTDTFGVSVIGNYDKVKPTPAAVEAVAEVIAWKLDLYHRNPLGTTQLTSQGGGTARYKAGTTVTLPVIMGHRNTGFTACPGKYLYAKVPWVRTRVTTIMQAALTNPSSSPDVTTIGTPLWLSARSLAAQTWQFTVTAGCNNDVVYRSNGTAAANQSFRATWNGKLPDGSYATPGAYTLKLTSSSAAGTARPVSNTVVIQPAPTASAPVTAPATGAGGYTAVTPARLADSTGSTTLATGPQARVDVPVLGQGGVPASGVTAVTLNVTVTCATAGSTLEVWPTGGTRTTKTLTSVSAGSTRSVLVTTQVGYNGEVSIDNGTGVTQLTADVVGYWSASGSTVSAIPATRILDTTAGTPLTPGVARTVTLPATLGGVPIGSISAVIADLSAIAPTGTGTLAAYPAGVTPAAANLTYRTGITTDNLTIVPVTNGTFSLLTTGGAAQATVDVRGLVLTTGTGGELTATTPVQVFSGTVAAGTPRTVTVVGGATGVPAGVTGVLVGLSATSPTATGSFELYQAGTTPASTAAMRVRHKESRGTVMLVPVGPDGKISVKLGAGKAPVVLTVRGYVN